MPLAFKHALLRGLEGEITVAGDRAHRFWTIEPRKLDAVKLTDIGSRAGSARLSWAAYSLPVASNFTGGVLSFVAGSTTNRVSPGKLVAGCAEDFFLEISDTGVELGVLHAAQFGFD